MEAAGKSLKRNPMYSDQPFKIGIFGYLHDGGNTWTTVPERWRARWEDIVELARMADRGGLDFLMPLARWKGLPGQVDNRLHCFETLTQAAALSAITNNIALFATVQTPAIHPVVAAKAIVTIDHASGGRSGINIVVGAIQRDFDMFGIELLEHDERYQQGQEWFDVWSRLVAGVENEFDYHGKHISGRGLIGLPGTLQKPRPPVVNAGFSPASRDYACRVADFYFTLFTDEEKARAEVRDMENRARQAGRDEPLAMVSAAYVVCRETRKEAENFHRYYAEEHADDVAVDNYIKTRVTTSHTPKALLREYRARWAAGNGNYPMVGNPEDVVEAMLRIKQSGFAGTTLSFLNYVDELPFFIERVLPLMEQAGLRYAHA